MPDKEMLGNLIWLSLINIKRRKLFSLLLFTMAFLVACSLFLGNISHKLLKLPDITEFRDFFYVIIYSVLVMSVLILAAVSAVSANLRRAEYSILRIFGAQRTDIFLLAVFESFFLCFFGALCGVLLIILLIVSKALYIPYFFEGMRQFSLHRLIGIGGQAIFAAVIIEVIVSAVLLFILLRKDILELERGAF
ncbi:MAG TPA: FtsX-like permease family protein [Spirochaetota bacterium]|nr:FtsX-like permease family protein [Spirochaetota bacterium]